MRTTIVLAIVATIVAFVGCLWWADDLKDALAKFLTLVYLAGIAAGIDAVWSTDKERK